MRKVFYASIIIMLCLTCISCSDSKSQKDSKKERSEPTATPEPPSRSTSCPINASQEIRDLQAWSQPGRSGFSLGAASAIAYGKSKLQDMAMESTCRREKEELCRVLGGAWMIDINAKYRTTMVVGASGGLSCTVGCDWNHHKTQAEYDACIEECQRKDERAKQQLEDDRERAIREMKNFLSRNSCSSY